MHKSKIKQISLAVCLAFMPLCGFAAGLGKLNVNSGLGEPLKAEIELLSVTPEELSTLTATIASEEAYAVQGITRLGIHNNIKVELAKNADGSPVLKIRSLQPVSDPYLDMLIQVDWASGRLLREYTVLLDPPEYKQVINEAPASSAVINKPSVATSVASKESAPAVVSKNVTDGTRQDTKKSKKSKKVSNQAAEQQDESSTSTDVPQLMTVRGDTLNSIAKEMQMEGVSLDQMLVGLYENNKSAFVDGNMNRLKVGQIVKAPSKDTLTAISPKQARQSVKVHSANWNVYRNNLAGNVLAAPVVEEAEQKQSASGKIASAEDKAAPAKSGPQDVVKLSAGGKVPAKEGKAGADFDAKILALQEEATTREKTLKESQERTATLEAQIADMQKLLALKSQTMTGLQKNAEVVVQPAEGNQAAPVPAPPVVPESVPAPAVSAPSPTPEQAVANEVKKTAPAVKATTPVQPEPQPEPTFIESLLGGIDLTILGGAAGVVLLGAGWMFLRNKRRKDLDSFERGILTSGGLRANTVFGNTTGNASTSDTSFLTDFAQSADGSMIDTNDVDPIAEAEVYMAYGRDAQAEEILKDAISKEPKRYELHLKLLEMYAGRKDISAFEAIAGELYTTLGADDPTWAKVAELGATVEPDNPLYDISKIATSTEVAVPKQDTASLDDVVTSPSDGLDFSFDDEATTKAQAIPEDPSSVVMQSFESTKDAEQNQSFDLGKLENDFSASSPVADSSIDSQPTDVDSSLPNIGLATDNSMDFDLTDLGSVSASSADSGLADESLSYNEVASLKDSAPAYEFTSSFDDNQAIELGAVTTPESSKSDEIDFGLAFNFPDTTVDVASDQTQEAVSNSTDFNFDGFDSALTQPDDKNVEEISFDFPLSDEPALPDATEQASTSSQQNANEFDFSSISLDLSGDESQTQAVQTDGDQATSVAVDLIEPLASENPDVDIKLDLVKAYIDMDDKEGARELLDEVAKEGGPQQRLRAEQLIASLA